MRNKLLKLLLILIISLMAFALPFAANAGYDDSEHTITFTQNSFPDHFTFEKTDETYNFKLVLDSVNVSEFDSANCYITLYDEFDRVVQIVKMPVDADDEYFSAQLKVDPLVSSYKVMLWDGKSLLKPLMESISGSVNASGEGENTSVTIDLTDIDTYGTVVEGYNLKLAYFKDDTATKSTQLNIENDYIIIWNKQESNFTLEDLVEIAECGEVSATLELFDCDGNGKYDLITGYEPAHFVVAEVDKEDFEIRVIDSNEKFYLRADEVDYTITIKNTKGEALSFEDIKVGDVIAVISDGDDIDEPETFIEITVLGESYVTGIVKATREGEVKVDSTWYEIDAAYEGKTLTLGSEGTFYIGSNGKIVAFVGAKAVNGNYGMIVKALATDSDWGDSGYQIKILDAKGQVIIYDVAEKVKIRNYSDDEIDPITVKLNDSESTIPAYYFNDTVFEDFDAEDATLEDLLENFEEVESVDANKYQRMVQFKVNSSNEVTDIAPAVAFVDSTSGKYDADDIDIGTVAMDASTVIFNVKNEIEDGKILTIDSLLNDADYTVAAFGYDDDSKTYGAVAILDGGATLTTTVDGWAVVTAKAQITDENDSEAYEIEIVENGSKEVKTIIVTEDTEVDADYNDDFAIDLVADEEFGVGSIILYTANAEGEVETIAVLANIVNDEFVAVADLTVKAEDSEYETTFAYGEILGEADASFEIADEISDQDVTVKIISATNEYRYGYMGRKTTVTVGPYNGGGVEGVEGEDDEDTNYVFVRFLDGKVTDIISIDTSIRTGGVCNAPSVTIDLTDIDEDRTVLDGTTIKLAYFNENGMSVLLRIEDEHTIIWNKQESDYNLEDLVEIAGWGDISATLELVDLDGNGEYELITGYEPAHFVVAEVDEEDFEIRVIDSNEKFYLKADEVDYTITIKNTKGEALSFEDIKVGDVIAVISDGGYSIDEPETFIEITVLGESYVTGIVKSTREGEVKVDSTWYEIDAAYEGKILTLGSEGTFYIGSNGKIVAFVGAKAVNGNYGMIVKALATDSDWGDSGYQIKILDAKGQVIIYDVAEKVKIRNNSDDEIDPITVKLNDAESTIPADYFNDTVFEDFDAEDATLEDLLENFEEIESVDANKYQRMIQFKVNSSNQITEIAPAYGATGSIAAKYDVDDLDIGSITMDSSTVIFNVKNAIEDGEIITIDSLINGVDYTVVGFAEDEDTETHGVVIILEDGASLTTTVKGWAVVTSKAEVSDEDDNTAYEIDIVENGSKEAKTILITEDTVLEADYNDEDSAIDLVADEEFGVGSVILYVATAEGEVKTLAVLANIVYDEFVAVADLAVKAEDSEYETMFAYGEILGEADASFEIADEISDGDVTVKVISTTNEYRYGYAGRKTTVTVGPYNGGDVEDTNRVFVRFLGDKVADIISIDTSIGTAGECKDPSVTIDLTDIDEDRTVLDGTTIKLAYFNENGMSVLLGIEDDHEIVWNNQESLYDLEDLVEMAEYGDVSATLELVDLDGNGKYDVITGYEPTHFIVAEINEENFEIKATSGERFYLKADEVYYNITIKNANGEILSFEDIKVGDVIAVISDGGYYIDEPETFIEITVFGESYVTGIVKSTREGEVKVNSTWYEIDAVYEGKTLTLGSEGTFYIGSNGKIVAFDGTKAVSGNYGMIVKALATDSDWGDSGYQIKILDAKGQVIIYDVAEKVKIRNNAKEYLDPITVKLADYESVIPADYFDGTVFEGLDYAEGTLEELLTNFEEEVYDEDKFERVIQFKTNSSNEITEIAPAYGATGPITAKYDVDDLDIGSIVMDSSTVIFNVKNALEDGEIITIDSLLNDADYTVVGFAQDEDTETFGAVIILDGGASLTTTVEGWAVVTAKFEVIDEDDNTAYEVEIVENGSKEVKTIIVTEDTEVDADYNSDEYAIDLVEDEDFDIGSIILYTANAEGEVETIAVLANIVYDEFVAVADLTVKAEDSEYETTFAYGLLTGEADTSFEIADVLTEDEVTLKVRSTTNEYRYGYTGRKTVVNVGSYNGGNVEGIEDEDDMDTNAVFARLVNGKVVDIISIDVPFDIE